MARSKPFYYYPLMLLSYVFFVCTANKSDSKTYIIHVAKPDQSDVSNPDLLKVYHKSFLPAKTTSDSSDDERGALVYSYKHVISGFSARLTPDELESMKTTPGFISAKEETTSHPHTTHSPDFLGLHRDQTGFWKSSNYGQGVIIGLLDTGILPNHPSFNDEGMPPPPKKWKGKCDFKTNTSLYRCNNKLIGARIFSFTTPLDDEGHGTHTAGTAGGNFVANASVLGNGGGTSAGLAPRAHLAMYKVCSASSCLESNILAGLDAAIEDGVDVISLSLGKQRSGVLSGVVTPYYEDNIAVGSFAAVQKGVLVSSAAGNDGPGVQSLSNEAPWLLTVGASTMDRSIRATAKLGDGQEFDGESAFQPVGFPSETKFPLIYAGLGDSRFCAEGALEGLDVKGKIVVCDRGGGVGRVAKGKAVKKYGASGMILANDEDSGFTIITDVHALPATGVSFAAAEKIKAYINSTKNPMATIVFKGTVTGDPMALAVAYFSSRGPSATSPGILKPDIIGPGVSVVAAWPHSLVDEMKTEATFNFLSGTSMSCPHLSGIGALLKSAHPNWSPAAIKSALMTTADVVNLKGQPIVDQTLKQADAYGSGSGHVNPSRANDPGLVYDIASDDYIPYLCGLGYMEDEVGIIAHKKVSCAKKIAEGDLNYPNFVVDLGSGGKKSYARTVTNVGSAVSSYTVKVVEPNGISVSVVPQTLQFKALNEKLSYNVTFTQNGKVSKGFTQGSLTWVSGKYVVRSVIVPRIFKHDR